MKIAIPVTNENQVDDHFGHCEFYIIATLANDKTIESVQELKAGEGCGCKSDIAQVLATMGVTVLLAGGIGNGAINVLNKAGIDVIRGCSGNVDALLQKYSKGLVLDNGLSCQEHDNHHSGEGLHVCSH